jgi:hypothetical protein
MWSDAADNRNAVRCGLPVERHGGDGLHGRGGGRFAACAESETESADGGIPQAGTARRRKTLTVPTDIFMRKAITDVRVVDSVVAATVLLSPNEHSILADVPQARALGVRGNCVVEVAVTFYGNVYPSDEGSGDVTTSAIDIAHLMMDNISALS